LQNAELEKQVKLLEKEKKDLEVKLSEAVQQTELDRLTSVIQEKEEQLRELSSALKRDVEGEEAFKTLTLSVMKHGDDQWYDIGIELGYEHAQVMASTKDIPKGASKIRALINMKRAELGRDSLTDVLWHVSKSLPFPIFQAVAYDVTARS
jgi:hypothetical protein